MAQADSECVDSNCLATDPLVSVVMITYNHERYLAEAIEGVVRQETRFPVELLIGEDCSTDGTREIALSYQKRFPEMIRVITSERNVGMHENFARVLAAARGKYLAFCEGDDVWIRSDKLERQVALLESNPDINLVCSNFQIISDSGAILTPDALHPPNVSEYYIPLEDVLPSRIVYTVTVCARREQVMRALVESPICRKHAYQFRDVPLWFELTRHGKCCCVPEVFCSYRLSNNSATRQPDFYHQYHCLDDMLRFQNDVLDLYPIPGGDVTKVHATRGRLHSTAILGDPETARKQLQRLKELGVAPTIEDRLLSLMAYFVRPRTLGAAALKWCILSRRMIRDRYNMCRRDLSGRPLHGPQG